MIHRLNKTEKSVKNFIEQKKMTDMGMRVCVCFSGGVDSSVLLHILYKLKELLGIRLSACHFNHMIRADEADRDELFCKNMCERYGIPFFSVKKDVLALQKKSGKSLEETARDARYAWFEEVAMQYNIDRFATAHHINDQAETVLFRLLRGTTVAGLAGIPHTRGRFIRPLLPISREEIQRYADENQIQYVTDSSNCSERYTRNYIRHTLLPAAAQINSASVDAIARLANYAAEDDALLSELLPLYEEKQAVRNLPIALLRRVVARNYQAVAGGTLCYTHVDRICDAVYTQECARLSLPNGYTAVYNDGKLWFAKTDSNPNTVCESGILEEGFVSLCNGAVRISLRKENLFPSDDQKKDQAEFVYNLSTEIPLSCDGIYGMIRYRARESGDRLCLHGVNRSVKKLFSEHKIPIYLREAVPIFYDNKGIFCVPFVAVADRVYQRENKPNMILRVEIDTTRF